MKTYTLEEIKELCEKATKGELVIGSLSEKLLPCEIYLEKPSYETGVAAMWGPGVEENEVCENFENNARLFAAANQIIPQLVGQLEKAIEALRFYAKRHWALDGVYPSPYKAKDTLKELGVE